MQTKFWKNTELGHLLRALAKLLLRATGWHSLRS